jgi:peptidyl-dipeptidase A
MLSTEAVALLMGSLVNDHEWLIQILGVPSRDAGLFAREGRNRERAERLIFTRWSLVMTYFEKYFYADPDRDLDSLWWDLVERYQLLSRPPNREASDWAAKYHVALVPVYYQNYQLGHLTSAQFQQQIEDAFGGLTGRQAAGRWLIERVFRPGARMDWACHVEHATQEPLNPHYFLRSVMS